MIKAAVFLGKILLTGLIALWIIEAVWLIWFLYPVWLEFRKEKRGGIGPAGNTKGGAS